MATPIPATLSRTHLIHYMYEQLTAIDSFFHKINSYLLVNFRGPAL